MSFIELKYNITINVINTMEQINVYINAYSYVLIERKFCGFVTFSTKFLVLNMLLLDIKKEITINKLQRLI